MDSTMIDAHLENIDRRLANVEHILLHSVEPRLTKLEQILPTLATKEDLKALATKEELKTLATKQELHIAIEPLATNEELRLAIEPLATKEGLRLAIEPLATKQELQLAIEPLATKEDLLGLRRHLTVLIESQNDKINLLIDFVHSLRLKRSE